MPWRLQVERFLKGVFNQILPPVCAGCRKTVGTSLCDHCVALMTWLSEPICCCCGRVLSRPTHLCSSCRLSPPPLQQIRTAVLFLDPIPPIIHQFKYNGAFGLAEPLAGLMLQAWPRWQIPVDLVLPIPLHADRLKTRGYNQSALLARYFCQDLNLETAENVLQRTRYTQPQVHLSATERQENVAGAFFAESSRVAGKEVLLVDDVCTTGSTLSAAAQALLTAGAKSVSAYCLARAS